MNIILLYIYNFNYLFIFYKLDVDSILLIIIETILNKPFYIRFLHMCLTILFFFSNICLALFIKSLIFKSVKIKYILGKKG